MRGNRGGQLPTDFLLRSIPASAGEPALEPRYPTPPGVYPRECGGTERVSGNRRARGGLSPRVRGNRGRSFIPDIEERSIPASAGEPPAWMCGSARCTVYPRECGGTGELLGEVVAVVGLSPRVRGNHASARASMSAMRSIPASAGEPWIWLRDYFVSKVYPRECGGTGCDRGPGSMPYGLSPRVRGNRRQAANLIGRSGSIPASAGEPSAGLLQSESPWVYPRECGGTSAPPCMMTR